MAHIWYCLILSVKCFSGLLQTMWLQTWLHPPQTPTMSQVVTSKFVHSNVRLISSWISDTQGVWHAWHMYMVFSVVLMSAMHGILVTNACMFFETALWCSCLKESLCLQTLALKQSLVATLFSVVLWTEQQEPMHLHLFLQRLKKQSVA